MLSSTDIVAAKRVLNIGRYMIPLGKARMKLLQKSQHFWKLLGEKNIFSIIQRVPITFPPDKFRGAQLSAMCVPDLLGTQGTFLLFTTRPSEGEFKEGGMRVPLEGSGDHFETRLEGPENMFLNGDPPLSLPLTIDLDRAANTAKVNLDGEEYELRRGELSDWITLTFKAAPLIKVSGICRMQITEMEEHLSLYITPISLDPENPAMPVSHPSYYSTYLAKRIGPYSTLGLAEDTWALNERVIDEEAFLKQAWSIFEERKTQLWDVLAKTKKGFVTVVFDTTDRIQENMKMLRGLAARYGRENDLGFGMRLQIICRETEAEALAAAEALVHHVPEAARERLKRRVANSEANRRVQELAAEKGVPNAALVAAVDASAEAIGVAEVERGADIVVAVGDRDIGRVKSAEKRIGTNCR